MEAVVIVIGIISLVIIGFIGYMFLGLALKICILWIPIIFSLLIPSLIGFAFGAVGGGFGILSGLICAYLTYEYWEDNQTYNIWIKKIDKIFHTEWFLISISIFWR